MKAKSAKGHTLKHARSKKTKHSATSKHHPVHHAKAATAHAHHVTAKAKHPGHAKARGLALTPGDVACCAAEALAASLRLAGRAVSDEDVLALYWHTADDPDAGAPILATLEAAWRYGLAGVRPVSYREITPGTALPSLPGDGSIAARSSAWCWMSASAFPSLTGRLHCGPDAVIEEAWAVGPSSRPSRAGSILLGVDLPGPHTITAVPGGWLSWGELYCPCEWPDAVVEEAWAVSWA